MTPKNQGEPALGTILFTLDEDLIPFLAKNQFKEILKKYKDEAMSNFKAKSKRFDMNQRIDLMLNPDQNQQDKDSIKIMMHIDPMMSQN